jgi:hypothetical protein
LNLISCFGQFVVFVEQLLLPVNGIPIARCVEFCYPKLSFIAAKFESFYRKEGYP